MGGDDATAANRPSTADDDYGVVDFLEDMLESPDRLSNVLEIPGDSMIHGGGGPEVFRPGTHAAGFADGMSVLAAKLSVLGGLVSVLTADEPVEKVEGGLDLLQGGLELSSGLAEGAGAEVLATRLAMVSQIAVIAGLWIKVMTDGGAAIQRGHEIARRDGEHAGFALGVAGCATGADAAWLKDNFAIETVGDSPFMHAFNSGLFQGCEVGSALSPEQRTAFQTRVFEFAVDRARYWAWNGDVADYRTFVLDVGSTLAAMTTSFATEEGLRLPPGLIDVDDAPDADDGVDTDGDGGPDMSVPAALLPDAVPPGEADTDGDGTPDTSVPTEPAAPQGTAGEADSDGDGTPDMSIPGDGGDGPAVAPAAGYDLPLPDQATPGHADTPGHAGTPGAASALPLPDDPTPTADSDGDGVADMSLPATQPADLPLPDAPAGAGAAHGDDLVSMPLPDEPGAAGHVDSDGDGAADMSVPATDAPDASYVDDAPVPGHDPGGPL